MKKLISTCTSILSLLLLLVNNNTVFAQDSLKKDLTTDVAYFVLDNKVPYLVVTTKTKVGKKFIPVENVSVKVYLDKDSSGKMRGSLGEFKTNIKGKAAVSIPVTMKDVWNASEGHTFYAVVEDSKKYSASDAELTISKARISIDTADDKNIKITVTQLKNKEWVPVKGVEVKIGVKRFDSYLPVGDEATYATDSLGGATAEFKRNKIPGDKIGNIILVARIEDNDQFGNVSAEKQVRWGSDFIYKSTFEERTLWSTRMKTPIWLLIMAYSIFLTVWGTLIYLVGMVWKIRKLGKQEGLS